MGSYAGAMGKPQFMPSSFRAYAVDATGDGKRDIWNNWADVAGSVANYFVEHGWRSGEQVVAQTQVRHILVKPSEIMTDEQARVLYLTRRGFVRAGAALEGADRDRLSAIKERLAVLGYFAGSISHELRNPLAAIDYCYEQGWTDGLPVVPPAVERYICEHDLYQPQASSPCP